MIQHRGVLWRSCRLLAPEIRLLSPILHGFPDARGPSGHVVHALSRGGLLCLCVATLSLSPYIICPKVSNLSTFTPNRVPVICPPFSRFFVCSISKNPSPPCVWPKFPSSMKKSSVNNLHMWVPAICPLELALFGAKTVDKLLTLALLTLEFVWTTPKIALCKSSQNTIKIGVQTDPCAQWLNKKHTFGHLKKDFQRNFWGRVQGGPLINTCLFPARLTFFSSSSSSSSYYCFSFISSSSTPPNSCCYSC